MELLCVRWGFDRSLYVGYIGKNGGFALLWLNDLNIQIESYSSNHINSTITGDNGKWRFTGFYDFPKTNRCGLS